MAVGAIWWNTASKILRQPISQRAGRDVVRCRGLYIAQHAHCGAGRRLVSRTTSTRGSRGGVWDQASAVPELTHRTVSLPLSRGGLFLQSASRTHPAAYWASWADGLETVQKRHPEVAQLTMGDMHLNTRSGSIRGVVECEGILETVGFDVPTWEALAEGAHPLNPEVGEDSTAPRVGWQRPAPSRLHEQCVSELWPAFSEIAKALMRSQSVLMCGEPFTCFPTARVTRFDSQ